MSNIFFNKKLNKNIFVLWSEICLDLLQGKNMKFISTGNAGLYRATFFFKRPRGIEQVRDL